MIRFLAVAIALLIPALADTCPWQRQYCQPGTVVVYQPRTCCWQPQRVQIVRVVEVKPVEPPQTPVVKPDPELEKWAKLKGRIVWDKKKNGEAPKRVCIVATTDAAVVQNDGDFYTEDWVVNQNNLGIKNVVVWVVPEPSLDVEIAALKKAIEDNKSYKFASFQPNGIHPRLRVPATIAILEIPALRFAPHVFAAREG